MHFCVNLISMNAGAAFSCRWTPWLSRAWR